MGNCAVHQYTKKVGGLLNVPLTAKVIRKDGTLLEFEQPVKASLVLSQHPNFFLCSSESMYVGCYMPQMSADEELQLGQVYFLMPLSNSRSPLSLQELCAHAIKANAVLADDDQSDMQYNTHKKMPWFLRKAGSKLTSENLQFCNISIDLRSLFRIFKQDAAIRSQ